MKVEDLNEDERRALYRAYKAFCTDFQHRADSLIQNDAGQTLETSDELEVTFNVDRALNEHDYDVKMAAAGQELGATFAHAAKRTAVFVPWPPLEKQRVDGRNVLLRLPLDHPVT